MLVRLLWPKMRKRSGRLAGKGAPGSARSAVLNFLAAAESSELAPLLYLSIQPLSSAFRQSGKDIATVSTSPDRYLASPGFQCPCVTFLALLWRSRFIVELGWLQGHLACPSSQPSLWRSLFEEPWWAARVGKESIAWWLGVIDTDAAAQLPLTVKLGFLNAATDMLQHLGHRLQPFLPEIVSLLLALLETAQPNQVAVWPLLLSSTIHTSASQCCRQEDRASLVALLSAMCLTTYHLGECYKPRCPGHTAAAVFIESAVACRRERQGRKACRERARYGALPCACWPACGLASPKELSTTLCGRAFSLWPSPSCSGCPRRQASTPAKTASLKLVNKN